MGCCFTKFRPKKLPTPHSKINVQENIASKKISPFSPPSPTTSNSSVSSLFGTESIKTSATCTISSYSSVSSVPSSSILVSKDRSFSNEFLWSCVKENPHIVHINSIKEASRNVHARKLDSPSKTAVPYQLKQAILESVNSSTPQTKTVGSNSPNHQQIFRKELNRVDSWYSSRGLKSPSPSRRASSNENVYNCRKTPTKRAVKEKPENDFVISSARKEKMRPFMVMNSIQYYQNSNVNTETCIHRINSKIDEVAVEEAVARHDIFNSDPVEDIENPLISLDCFIFL